MTKHKVAELEGTLLDAAVATTEGFGIVRRAHAAWAVRADHSLVGYLDSDHVPGFHPSADWSIGGPIIEREGLDVTVLMQSVGVDYEGRRHVTDWWAERDGIQGCGGRTPLEAAMRAYVQAKLGDEIELPDAP